MGAGSETYASLMKSFIALLHCTFSSSSSLGAWDVKRDDVGQGGTGHNKEHVKGDKCQLVTCQNCEQVITSEAEMYIISSMAGRSLGNGNRF